MDEAGREAANAFAGVSASYTHHVNNITQSDKIDELATALSKAQGTIKGAAKDAKNPFFKSSYADLTAVWDACRETLSENGLAVIQTTEYRNGHVALITTLAHSGGQWIRGTFPVKPVKDDPQGLGSAMTYARRYSLAAMVGIAPKGEDDDGEGAMGRKEAAVKGETSRDVWGGPMKKQAFQAALHAFTADLVECTEYDTLIGLLNMPETIELLAQCERDRPSWWYGTGGDVVGVKDRIETRKVDLAAEQPPGDA